MADAALSIGDVIKALRPEFPDVTVSKIRFLETQGLVEPERTATGYRRFAPDQVERLKWVLRQQREHFLPLKVIRERLEDGSGALTAQPRRRSRAKRSNRPELRLTAEEVAQRSGLTKAQVGELEKFGLLVSKQVGSRRFYGVGAVDVAKAAAAFHQFGIESRHLRLYKNVVEREAGLFEQVIAPLAKQRGKEDTAFETLDDLARLGGELHGALLRNALRDVEP